MADTRFGEDVPGVDWSKISPEGDCWIWNGKVGRTGHPAKVHRVLLSHETGETRSKSRLLCGNTRCVNPRHREWMPGKKVGIQAECSVAGCTRISGGMGLCELHRTRERIHGTATPGITFPSDQRCGAPGCDRGVKAAGLCVGHYNRKLRGQPIDTPVRGWGRAKCSHPGCPRAHEAQGLCSIHYQRKTSGKNLDDPIRPKYRPTEGERWNPPDRDGYIRGFAPDVLTGKVEPQIQHRYVLEVELGRKLTRDETVHHKNGVRDDNRRENLELWSSSHPPGQRVEDKVLWAKEIIQKYDPTWYAAGH